ncbi:MAG: flagellar biosynthetic protein FliR [Candidatus Eremiobacteraeota bacterium]|nr:flagellar biosynthetic protein FliR [Candidatus Eremiobacteraeota bacterium]
MTATALLVLARCAGFVFRAPGFSHPSVPPSARAGLAAVLTLGVLPAVNDAGGVLGLQFLLAIATELAIGGAIGVAASVLYDGAYAAGRALDDYVGIRGSVPTAAIFAASGFGRIWSVTFLAGFFLLRGYDPVIRVLAEGFRRLPPAATLQPIGFREFAIALPALIIKAAVLIAGPAIALVFVMQCALGTLSRVIPRFANFTLSFPINFAGVLLLTIVMVPLLIHAGARPWIFLPFLGRSP